MMDDLNLTNQIKDLKEKIGELQEYLLSDCCKKCKSIIDTIEKHEQEIQLLLRNTKD